MHIKAVNYCQVRYLCDLHRRSQFSLHPPHPLSTELFLSYLAAILLTREFIVFEQGGREEEPRIANPC